jgi:glycosyltransferase involved in cell wall biosynthesis
LTRARRYRLAVVATHPTQITAPIYRRLASNPSLDLIVAYCSLQGAEAALDREFGVEVKWDVPLLDGYSWVQIPNRSFRPGVGHFLGLINPGLWGWLRKGNFDAVLVHTGYLHCSYWIVIAAAKTQRIPLIFATDAVTLASRVASRWKKSVKAFLVPRIYNLNEIVAVASSAGKGFIRGLGIPEGRIVLVPNVVDNEWWIREAEMVDRAVVRTEWSIPESSRVVLFCAKLQPWKRPQDVLRAFAKADVRDTYLVLGGEGPLRAGLEAEAKSLGINERTRFLGFVNQTRLPRVYRACDLFIVPSEFDPCPFVVCEAMLCGCPVVLSDEIRGRFDLVRDGVTGFIYPCGDIGALAAILSNAMANPDRLKDLSSAAAARIATWSPRESVSATVLAVERALHMRTCPARDAR